MSIFVIIINFFTIRVNTAENCDVDKYCGQCSYCGVEGNDYTKCSYNNIFCTQKSTNYTIINETYLYNYNIFFRNIENANIFCGQENYTLDSLVDSFPIIKKSNKDIKNSNINHCDYKINNNKYFYNFDDGANLIIKYKANDSEKNTIKFTFNILLRDSRLGLSKLRIIKETDLVLSDYELNLKNYDIVKILLDFYVENEINENIDEYLEIKINTDNPSIERERLMKILIIVIFSFLALVIIALLIAIYYRCKKMQNLVQAQNEILRQEELKKKEKHEKINKLFETLLIPKIFNEKDVSNDCTECAICIEKFTEKNLVCITPCKHIFHYECLKKCVETAKSQEKQDIKCPLCNYDFLEEKNVDKKLNEITNVNEINNNLNNGQQNDFTIRSRVINVNPNNRGVTSDENLRIDIMNIN